MKSNCYKKHTQHLQYFVVAFMLIAYSGLGNISPDSLKAKLKTGQEFVKEKKYRDAENFFLYVLSKAEISKNGKMEIEACKELSHLFAEQKKYDKAFYYQSKQYALHDTFIKFNSENTLEALRMRVEVEKKQSAINQLKAKEERNTIFMYALISSALLLIVVATAIYRRYKERARTEKILEKTNEELKESITHLREAETQLINSEKMSSLARLSAAIAHELRNPLNFITNFSETSSELIDEVETATSQDEKRQLSKFLTSNVAKISEHSSRANKIISNMLQHERAVAGNLQLTDINELCSECIELAVNGLKSTGKIFDGKIVKSLGDNLPKTALNRDEITSVLINLLNNAMFAVLNSSKTDNHFEPTIEVSTVREFGKVYVSVMDNGMGIPPSILQKIFEPFFTTKMANEGTGLGLSICYDIIKNHGGNITVESKQGIGTKFTFWIPA